MKPPHSGRSNLQISIVLVLKPCLKAPVSHMPKSEYKNPNSNASIANGAEGLQVSDEIGGFGFGHSLEQAGRHEGDLQALE